MIIAVHDRRSIGIATYVRRLGTAMNAIGVDYRPAARAGDDGTAHFHLANSTRSVLPAAACHRAPFLVTVHDVLPRARVLRPLQRALVAPICFGRASRVVVHSEHAARMLADLGAVDRRRVEIIPHPASTPRFVNAREARLALDIDPAGPPLFVLPGVLKAAKLVREVLWAAEPLLEAERLRLLLAGHVFDDSLARRAIELGAIVLPDPDVEAYERVIVAADAVICVRGATVGEANGPLLDAIGAGRPSLVSTVGSGPELAAGSARAVAPAPAAIRSGIEALLDAGERQQRAAHARERAAALTWHGAARRHRELLEEMTGG